MINDQARISLVAQRSGALSCALGTVEANIPSATAVIQHPRGEIVQFATCGWCIQALLQRTRASHCGARPAAHGDRRSRFIALDPDDSGANSIFSIFEN
jgi:hypothetical protein